MVHIIFLFALFFTFPDLNKKYPFWLFTFATLFLFSALRYDYGTDYMEYYNIHTALNAGLPAWGQNDLLFKQINLWISNFYLLIALMSLFYILVIYNMIKKNLKIRYYWFAVLILIINPYLFLVQLSSIRQTLAICFFIIAINYAVKRNLLVYSLLVLTATGFHASAIILFPIYFLLNDTKLKKRTFIVIISFLIFLLVTPVFDILANRLLEYMPQHYNLYYEQGLQNSIRSTLLSSFYFFFVLFNINKLEGREMIYGKLSLISTVIALLAFKVSMVTRIGMYFDIFLIITIPQIFLKIKSKLYRQVLFIMMIVIYLLRYYSFFTHPSWSQAYGIYRTILGQ
jgi:transmembrane protein EpsG